MRDIARRANVGLATLLRHFPSREALFEALDQLIGNKDLRDSLGRQGRERVVHDFQWRDRVEAFLAGAPYYE